MRVSFNKASSQRVARNSPCAFSARKTASSPLIRHSQRVAVPRGELRGATITKTSVVGNVSIKETSKDEPKFKWADAWYPIGEEQDFDRKKPHGFTLLGKGVVVWFDPKTNAWKSFRDLCPHRLIPLSEGRVNERGHLECGYHGWEFNNTGGCETIPQALPEAVGHKSERACVETYPCVVKQGLIWVRPTNINKIMMEEGSIGEDKIPLVEEMNEEGWIMRTVVRDIPYDFTTLLENVLDVSHVPFTHHGSVGNRANASPVDLDITARNPGGFEGIWKEGPRRGRYGSQYSQFRAPIMMQHKLDSYDKLGFSTMTVVYATPVAPGKCRLIARFPFKFKSPIPRLVFSILPRWATHPNEMLILEDDQLFLHAQEREVAELAQESGKKGLGQLYYMPTTADAFVAAFRAWVDRFGNGGPWGFSTTSPEFLRAIGPRQSDEQLLERFHSHSKNCKSCSAAVKTLERMQTAFRLLSPALFLFSSLFAAAGANSTAAAALPLLSALGTGLSASQLFLGSGVLGAASMALWIGSFAVENYKMRFMMGNRTPPRNKTK